MNAPLAQAGRIPLALGVVESADPAILAGIRQPGVAAAIWRRPRDPGFAAWIDALPPERLPRLSTLTTPELVERVVHAACDSAGTPAGLHRDRLASDAAALALILSQVAAQPLIEIRLEVVDTDKCRKFHIDRVRCRMLCTYRGAGTQYGAAAPGPDHAPAVVQQLSAADAALFRGAFWPGAEFPGVLHRSPPLAGTGETRLLLVVDPMDDVDGHC
ncbi:DUF1826 domain-containing protein [Rubrimonas cliftonensis]|uniref:DUF1826 domain-containing protein n=1 Tax=Rubrimonas cliftonensis TaxID=89524 RepID=A0A1H4GIR8_9RHOB|nr:DUF1826 domain-containing protein [Rubrimonas cliftonensis]SEB09505.1 Protein of unknown function [Rubrimonas cliftonensis]